MLENLDKKQKIIFILIISIMLLFIIYCFYTNIFNNSDFTYPDEFISTVDNIPQTNNSTISENIPLITVYICGEVNESKVIKLPENSRVIDAIEYVGGLTDEANINTINLASILEDGEKIYIPNKSEEIDYNNLLSSQTNSKININSASQNELEKIPGIGPSTSIKIINYRQKEGKFYSIEDIKKVSGIGDSKFENIKDYICVK